MNRPHNALKTLVRWVCELSPSCKEAARLQSVAHDRTLTPVESFGLRFHLLVCRWCRIYGKQIRFLRSVAQAYASGDVQHSTHPALSSEARERIKRSLQSGKG
jgi:hypothetical protein